MRKYFPVSKGPFSRIGSFLSIIGFVLTILCLVGCQWPSGRGLYFTKVADASAPADGSPPITVYYGWQGYCIDDGSVSCQNDRSIMIMPFDVSITNHLNGSYSRLFNGSISQDTDLNPGASPNPPHDPNIFPAAVLCLLCSACLIFFSTYRCVQPRKYQDEFYTRGFLALGSSVLSLLLLILSLTMYRGAVYQLNVTYPNLVASEGPGMTMIGCGFMSFGLAAFCFLRGCMRFEGSNDDGPEGYSAL